MQASAAVTESATTTTSTPGKVEMAQVVEGSAVITVFNRVGGRRGNATLANR